MSKTGIAKKENLIAARKKPRSCGYPLLSLPQAIEAAKILYGGFGEGPHSRQGAARGLGYVSFSGAASGKIGSLAHFGLLARANGMYAVTPLAKEIFLYPKEGSGEAVAKAAAKPVLYAKLFGRFLDKPLPEKLEAILAADYGVTAKAAPVAAKNFIETMEFANLILDGRLVFPESGDAIYSEKKDREPMKLANEKNANSSIKIKLPSGIEISFPQELAYRLSMGEFKDAIKKLENDAPPDGVKSD